MNEPLVLMYFTLLWSSSSNEGMSTANSRIFFSCLCQSSIDGVSEY